MNLTPKEEQMYQYIKNAINECGYPPSIRDIASALSIKSTSTVHYYLKKLEDKNVIKREGNINRGISLVSSEIQPEVPYDAISIPIVGRVAAGEPILADQNIEDYLPIPSSYLPRSGASFLLEVNGDSMIEAGILDGDYVLVHQTQEARNGDMVVALIDDEATVKTFYREKDHIRLQPENEAYSPILVYGQMSIVGIVRGVFRFLR